MPIDQPSVDSQNPQTNIVAALILAIEKKIDAKNLRIWAQVLWARGNNLRLNSRGHHSQADCFRQSR